MSSFKPGWSPTDEIPYVMVSNVTVTLRNDMPVARVTLYDVTDETRTIDLDEKVIWEMHRGLGLILEQLHRPR